MKAIEFLKLLNKENLSSEACDVVDGTLLVGDGYADYFPVEKAPILWSYFKENLTYFAYFGNHFEIFAFLPEAALSMPSTASDNERIYIWILED